MKGLNKGIILLTIILVFLMYPSTYIFLNGYISSINSTFKILTTKESKTVDVFSKTNSLDKSTIKILFIFDGGYKNVYENAYPVFKKYNLKGNVGVIPSLISEKEYMNVSELTNLYLDGWDILNQTFPYEPDLYDSPTKELEDIQKTKKWMDNRFFTRTSDSVIMTYGEINPYLIKLLKNKDFKSIRTSDNIIDLSKDKVEYKPIKAMDLSQNPDISIIKKFLEDTQKSNTTVVFIMSKVGEINGNDDKAFSQSSLTQLLEYIYYNTNKLEVISYSDLFATHG